MYNWEQSYLAYRWCDQSQPRYPSQITVTMVCQSLSQDDQTSVWCPCCPCAMSVLLSSSGFVFPKAVHIMFLWWKQKKTGQSACIQLFSPESCRSSALIFCQFEGTWDEQHKHTLPWKRCRDGVKFPDALSSDEEKINSRIM